MAPFSRYLAAVVNYKTFWSSGTTRPYSAPFVIDAEPYFISNTAEHLTFDERYVAWGGDKAEQFHRVMLQVIKARDNALVHTYIAHTSESILPHVLTFSCIRL